MFEKMKNGLRQTIQSFLRIQKADGVNINIDELIDFDGNAFMNEIWYRGEGFELEQLYQELPYHKDTFWGAIPTAGLEIRKIHTGMPRNIVNTLTATVADDLKDIKINDPARNETWQQIEAENKFKKLVKKAIKKCLVTGDGAFKISLDPDVSEYPIIEFFEADRIDVKWFRGRIKEITFKTQYHKKGNMFVLKEHYGFGYITYELCNKEGNEVDLATLDVLKDLKPVYFDSSFMMAEYLTFYESDKWEGRGQSVFDSKRDNFDALDEAWSQWVDALRANRTRTYIPEDLLPRDPGTGLLMQGNAFDNRFIKVNTPMQEGAQSKIDVEQGSIAHDSYLATYVTALDLCLQGIISPSTLGIDVKKLDNAEAQREKEKATLYTRQTIVTAIQETVPHLINKIFKTLDTLNNVSLTDVECEIPFGEYANPSFESQVETVGKAKTQGVMSLESAIEELYGDSKPDDWKEKEVKRLKEEQGIAEMEEPALNMDYMQDTTETVDTLGGDKIKVKTSNK